MKTLGHAYILGLLVVPTHAPVHKIVPPPKPVAVVIPAPPVVTWQDNPNNCTPNQYIAADAPFTCIDKPVAIVPAVAVSQPVSAVVAGCGDNSYANYIYSHESGCSTTVTNAQSGACGLGQAYPCSKLEAACPNMDYACENSFFTDYANSKYGSWEAAYNYWLGNHYW